MTDSKLKPLPCPFCGHRIVETLMTDARKWGAAYCCGCGASSGEVRTDYDDSDSAAWRQEAIAEWNRRTENSDDQ